MWYETSNFGFAYLVILGLLLLGMSRLGKR